HPGDIAGTRARQPGQLQGPARNPAARRAAAGRYRQNCATRPTGDPGRFQRFVNRRARIGESAKTPPRRCLHGPVGGSSHGAAKGRWARVKRLNGMDAMLLYSETPNLHTHTLKVAVIDAAFSVCV